MVGYKDLWHRNLKMFEKSHMKVARSVCKQWNRLVTPALFKVTFIAPNRKGLEISTAISQHEV